MNVLFLAKLYALATDGTTVSRGTFGFRTMDDARKFLCNERYKALARGESAKSVSLQVSRVQLGPTQDYTVLI